MADPSWKIAGYGDLDGDGERDIVWQDDSAWLGLWLMKGAQVVNTLWLSIDRIDPRWKVRAVGDVNRDGPLSEREIPTTMVVSKLSGGIRGRMARRVVARWRSRDQHAVFEH